MSDLRKCNYGEIWMANLNPSYGSEFGKVRPVVVVQNDVLNASHPSTIICPITTQVVEDSFPLRILVSKKDSKLERRSDIVVEQIRSIDIRRLKRRVSLLPEGILEQLKACLRIVLNIE